MRLRTWGSGGLATTVVVVLALAAPTLAAFPGQNGKIAFYKFESSDWDVYVVNSDGTGQTNLTDSQQGDQQSPMGSPDGSKIAYSRYVQNPLTPASGS